MHQLYDKSKIDWDHLQFDSKALFALLLPLMVEQLLNTFMGMADTVMVGRIGGAAISAVSLVDSINVLFIQVFAALAAGGTIVCSYYLGRSDREGATDAAKQVMLSVTALSTVITALCLLTNRPLLKLVFGSIEADVMANARTYFYITALSFPFLALSNAGAAFFRAGGESRLPMLVSAAANLGNIAGNAVLIFVCGWGVRGAAISTLVSRIANAVALFALLRRDRQPIVITDYRRLRPHWRTIRNVLMIGIPSGIENGMFQFGKLAIQSSVSTLGTAAIAAQALAIPMESLNGVAAVGCGIGLMTVVGQCIGAGKIEEAKYNVFRLIRIAWVAIVVSCAAVWLLSEPIAQLSGLEEESLQIFREMVTFITVTKPLFWVLAFIPGYGMRAAGDVAFSMIASSITMWLCRVTLAVALIRVFHFGPIAVWIGMAADWAVRSVIFGARLLSMKWTTKHILSSDTDRLNI